MNQEAAIEELASRIRRASRITVMTGAGVSAASGVPIFRGPGGLWRNYSPEELATPQAFARNPKLVWEWYNWRREVIAKCEPNRAHRVLAAWSRRYPCFSLITQNVDGLHERAGADRVIRFHGSIWEVLCWERCSSSPPRWVDSTVPFPVIPPLCPHCGGLIRPGVTWFGEMIDPDALERSAVASRCDLFVTAGTSSIVYPAAGLLRSAKAHGAFTAEINPGETLSSTAVDLSVRAGAEVVLPRVDSLLSSKAP